MRPRYEADGPADAHHGAGVNVVLPVNENAFEKAGLQGLDKLDGVDLVSLHCLIVLGGVDIGRMDYDTVNVGFHQRVVGGEPAEPRLVDGMVFAIGIMLPLKVKELRHRGFLRVSQKIR